MTPYYNKDGIKIFHGDCLEILPMLTDTGHLESESVGLLFTDPPYGHRNGDDDFAARRSRYAADGRKRPTETIQGDGHEWRILVQRALLRSLSLLARDSAVAVMCAGGGGVDPSFATLSSLMNDLLEFDQAFVWDKRARGPGLGMRIRRDYEFVMLAHKSGGLLPWMEQEAHSNILDFPPVAADLHPNQKPEALPAFFIRRNCPVGGVVLDPFMGAGTTLVAARALGFEAIGIELEERFCERAANRLAQAILR